MVLNLQQTNQLKDKALELGFMFCHTAKAEFLSEEAKRLEMWLNNEYHGQMSYMANHFDKRVDPRLLVPGAQSVISLAYNYYNPISQKDPEAPKVSMYAYGKDYHKVVKKKLLTLYEWMKSTYGDIDGRVFVDSAPVMESEWAKRSGLGWIGKNTLVIHPKKGSWFFLAEIITDLALAYDKPISDYCGTCTRCIDACPTEAIHQDGYVVDGSRCISYLTIELKDIIPASFEGKLKNWIFGCDICQQVCPWNRFATPHTEAAFMPSDMLITFSKQDWIELTEPVFNAIFEGSAIKRTKFEGLKRNIEFGINR